MVLWGFTCDFRLSSFFLSQKPAWCTCLGFSPLRGTCAAGRNFRRNRRKKERKKMKADKSHLHGPGSAPSSVGAQPPKRPLARAAVSRCVAEAPVIVLVRVATRACRVRTPAAVLPPSPSPPRRLGWCGVWRAVGVAPSHHHHDTTLARPRDRAPLRCRRAVRWDESARSARARRVHRRRPEIFPLRAARGCSSASLRECALCSVRQ